MATRDARLFPRRELLSRFNLGWNIRQEPEGYDLPPAQRKGFGFGVCGYSAGVQTLSLEGGENGFNQSGADQRDGHVDSKVPANIQRIL